MMTCRKALCTDTTNKRPESGRECTAAAEKLIRVFNELRLPLVTRLWCTLGSYDEAEDAAQEAFLKCWRHRDGVGNVRNLRAWVFRIGLNAAKDYLRSAWKQRARPLIGPPAFVEAPAACPVKCAEEGEAKERLQQAISTLRPQEREVFLLRYTSGLTYEEIATVQCRPVGTVKTQMRAAAAKLRQLLRET
jgi:RNA polymerase sigma-70 factor (ECF subfamily)